MSISTLVAVAQGASDAWVYAITSICLVAMILFAFAMLFRLVTLDRKQKLAFIKNFKRGKFAVIYMVAIPLFFVGCYFQSQSFSEGVFQAVTNSIKLIVLEYNHQDVSLLFYSNALYRATMDICYILVVFNAIFFVAALFWQRFSNFVRKQNALGARVCIARAKRDLGVFKQKIGLKQATKNSDDDKQPKDTKCYYVIVGFNQNNVFIINSIDKKRAHVMLACPASEDIAEFVYNEKISHIPLSGDARLDEALQKTFVRFDDKDVKVIINSGDDSQNLVYIEQLSTIIKEDDLSKYAIDRTRGLSAYVFGEAQNTSTFLRFVKDTSGCVQYVNRHKLIAMEFVDKYPLTQYMTADHIDYSSATVKPEVDVNVIMLGFGKTNQQLFLTSVANNQFMQLENDKVTQKNVNYFIYDKKDSKNDKNLNHNYARFSNEIDRDGDYLDLPDKPANETFYLLDINSTAFYDSIKHNLESKDGRLSYNYVIIAVGDDLENLDVTEKITAKLAEWGLASSKSSLTKVFVRILNDNLCTNVIDKNFAKINESENKFVTFGNEMATVYDVKKIIDEKFVLMARDKHISYQTENAKTPEEKQEALLKAWHKWYNVFDEVQRESNIYACLSIRMKLHLLGFDYALSTSPAEDKNEEYLLKYQGIDEHNLKTGASPQDRIIYKGEHTIDSKNDVLYTNDFVEGSIRQIYAMQEHQRWNAYMITCGIVPSTKTQIEKGDSKNLALRRHGNISTFEGLKEFRKIMVAVENNKPENKQNGIVVTEEQTDVIRYDYQIMDDLVWLLDHNDYKIVKK